LLFDVLEMTDGLPGSLSQLRSELIVAIGKRDKDRAQRVQSRIDEIESQDSFGVNGATADTTAKPIYVRARQLDRQISDPEFAALQLLWKKVLKEYGLPNSNIDYTQSLLAIALSDHSALEVRSSVVEVAAVSDAQDGTADDDHAKRCGLRIPAGTQMQMTDIIFHGEAVNDDKAIMASLDYLKKLYDDQNPIEVYGNEAFISKVRNLAKIMGVDVKIAPARPASGRATDMPSPPGGRPPLNPA
jgi:hypothetical protein